VNPEVFREYDVRGIVNKDLNSEFVYGLGQAIGTYGRNRDVSLMTVGRDCRLSSEEFHDAITKGIMAAGIDVIDIGLCATPMLYFSIRHLKADGGVMVTGSHNPPEFNGFKICIGPDTIYGQEIQQLKKIMENSAYLTGRGTIGKNDITNAYYDSICGNVEVKTGIHVVVDGGNGVGGFFALPLLKRFECTVLPLYCDMDGRFPHHFPDPTIEENLAELIRVVKRERADVGIAYDGDADRIGVITERGDILWGDELLILFSRLILKENPGATIIGEVKCSQKLYDDIDKNGGRAIMWKAGHSLIKGKMREEKALLAGEVSGHLFFADRYYGYDDALYASARILEVLSKNHKNLSEILSDLPKSFSTPEIRIDFPDEKKFGVVKQITDYFRKDYTINDIDGVRVQFANGWGLVRASNTQPALVLRFESWTEEGLHSIRSFVEGIVANAMNKA
jgi:phosphomannomutase / phosphoglucomutase